MPTPVGYSMLGYSQTYCMTEWSQQLKAERLPTKLPVVEKHISEVNRELRSHQENDRILKQRNL